MCFLPVRILQICLCRTHGSLFSFTELWYQSACVSCIGTVTGVKDRGNEIKVWKLKSSRSHLNLTAVKFHKWEKLVFVTCFLNRVREADGDGRRETKQMRFNWDTKLHSRSVTIKKFNLMRISNFGSLKKRTVILIENDFRNPVIYKRGIRAVVLLQTSNANVFI